MADQLESSTQGEEYTTKNVVLWPAQMAAVKRVIEERRLPKNSGFSIALRIIIDEWADAHAGHISATPQA